MRPSALQLAAQLCEALRGEDDARVAALLLEGANPNLVLPEGVAAMHLAAGVEQEDGIHRLSRLLQHGGDPNVRSGEDLTPVHVAASWGCVACLRLLLMEGGDPCLEDQDGNTAIDLALEQDNETCVSILQGEGWSSCVSQRRAESFLSTVTEDPGETGPVDSHPCPSGRPPLSSLKEARQHGELRGAFSQPGGATPNGALGNCQDRSASSFLTECSWQGNTLYDLSDFCVQPAASANASCPSNKPVSSHAEGVTCWHSEVASERGAGANQPCDVQSPTEGRLSSPPRPGAVLLGNALVVPETLFSRGRPETPRVAASPEKPLPAPSQGIKSEPEADQCFSPEDPSTCRLSWCPGFLDPSLVVRLAGREGADVASPDHACLSSWAEATAVSDLGKTVVNPAPFLGGSRAPDGRSARGRSLSRCSATSTDWYVSCVSECYSSTVEGHVQKWEGGEAAFCCTPDGPSVSNGGSCSGPPAGSPEGGAGTSLETGLGGQRTVPTRLGCPQLLPEGAAQTSPGSQDLVLPHPRKREGPEKPWEALRRRASYTVDPPKLTVMRAESRASATRGPVEIQGLPAEHQGTTLPEVRALLGGKGGLQRLDLCPSPQDAAEGKPSLFTQDTLPVRRALEERNRFHGSGSPDPLDTGVALHPTASGGEEAPASLDSKLCSMMLATKVFHSPLLQSNRKGCPAVPQPQSPTIRPLPHDSLSSSSLFDETLEMPRRPRRVRTPRGPRPALDQGATAGNLGHPPPPAREADEPEGGRSVLAVPSRSKPAQSPGPRPLGRSLASPRRHVCRGEDLLGGTDLEAKKPSLGDGQASCDAPEIPEVGDLEGPGAQGSPGKRAQKPSRVSFSRLSARGPSASCHPGRLSPISQDVPLSPGGRPANLSATAPVEYLYVDEEEGHTLVERHIPPADDSVASASSSEGTIIYDWQAYAREAAGGGQGNGGSAPLNSGLLSDEALARKLRDFGVNPGPVTALTRKVYLQLLEKLSRDPKTEARKGSAACSPELASALETYQIPDSKADEMALATQFDRPDKSRKWREGLLKSSFNYLLLDPRVTQNLPFRCQFLTQAECFQTFVSAVFYVGKGKRSRPYRHLYEALTHHREGRRKRGAQACSKVRHILEIWASGQGVISMHCFQNVIPVEAYTREACMVDAIGLKMLTNQKKGNYYGTVASWPMKRRRSLGVYLLHRALQIFLAEGERQLRPADI
ncbi:ankyrin repeat and LEM domain-containing protein 1 [Candoia aspera]|uniref:ankyrin repeat and LEM domain-containing protein 1 n=1 Tax=Candoia aspera TaxID=51853 RepID=UPI002FD7BCBB